VIGARDGVSVRDRVVRRAGRINREIFREGNHDLAKTAVVLGSGRGGTTWLAEVMAREHGSRVLFEPFHPRIAALNSDLALFLAADAEDLESHRRIARVLSGRVRHRQIDHIQSPRFPASRVVKDIHATNLAPWMERTFPQVPIVYVVRHPLATSVSRLRAGVFNGLGSYLETKAGRRWAERSPVAEWLPLYDRYAVDEDPLVRLVAEWCIENVYPLSRMVGSSIAFAHYERLVLDPAAEIGRLLAHCASALGSGAGEAKLSGVREPSAMDWFGTAAKAGTGRDWESILARWTEEVPPGQLDECLAVVENFGIDVAYGEDPLPRQAIRAE
jgi:sulfotransferase family protein